MGENILISNNKTSWVVHSRDGILVRGFIHFETMDYRRCMVDFDFF